MTKSTIWRVSPMDLQVCIDAEPTRLWIVELQDLARSFCGALLLALPLLYTMEMWVRARVVPAWDLAIIVVLTYFLNVALALYKGFKPHLRRRAAWFDALTAMGIGLAASAITLFLTARYTFDTPINIMVRILLIEMVPASIGANLAINQLGSRTESDADQTMESRFSGDVRKILGTLLGAIIFAFNIAPTIEPKNLTMTMTWWHILAVVLFSLAVSYVMVFFANFVTQDDRKCCILDKWWMETIVAYLISLLVSALLLWMFNYIGPDTPLSMVVPWLAVMGYATTLGGAAGRLVL